MKTYTVNWSFGTEAKNAFDAARQALATQRDPDSVAVVFSVSDGQGEETVVDLLMEDPTPKENWIIIAGDVLEGLNFFGPFSTHDGAAEFAESVIEKYNIARVISIDREVKRGTNEGT